MGRLLDFANRVAFGALRDSIPENDAEDIDDDWEERFRERVSADFRDLDTWPRDKEYNWREFGWPGDKSRAKPKGRIPWERLDTLVLHTTDTGKLGPKRFLGIPAQGGIDGYGGIVLMHDLNRLLYHAHSANRFSNGLEVCGRGTITPEQVEAGRLYIRWWCQTVRFNKAVAAGPPALAPEDIPLHIIPHRHSHWSRRMDPGPDVWEALGQWAIEMLPNVTLGRVVGSGQRIPERGQPW